MWKFHQDSLNIKKVTAKYVKKVTILVTLSSSNKQFTHLQLSSNVELQCMLLIIQAHTQDLL